MSIDVDALTITDDIVFKDVFGRHADLCRELLEVVLDEPIAKIERLVAEDSIKQRFDARGVALDVRATAADGRVFDVEMQNASEKGLIRRARYYADMLDLDAVAPGSSLAITPDAYTIFICNFDPLEREEPIYTFVGMCREVDGLELGDGRTIIFLNLKAADKATGRRSALFRYLAHGESGILGDEFLMRVDECVRLLRSDDKWRRARMDTGLLMERERELGREEGREEGREAMVSLSARLFESLSSAGRLDEYARALSDLPTFDRLCQELGIEG